MALLQRLTGIAALAAQDVVQQQHATDKHSDRYVMKQTMKKI
jgi:hypothetical protein